MCEPCVICSGEASGLHFGVMACRACSAFFRRSVGAARLYRCQQHNNCPISRADRNVCRACRLEKCRNVGMDEHYVQLRPGRLENSKRSRGKRSVRPKPRPTPDHLQQHHFATPEPDSSPASDRPESSSESRSNWSQLNMPCSGPDVMPGSSCRWPLLEEMGEGIREMDRMKKVTFVAFNPHLVVQDVDPLERPITATDHIKTEIAAVGLTYTMLKEYFRPFASMPQGAHKRRMLETFCYTANRMLYCHNTFESFPDLDDPRVKFGYGNVVDITKLEQFFEADKKMTESVRLFRPYILHMQRFGRRIKRLQVDTIELAAMAGCVLWGAGYDVDLCRDVLHRIHQELFEYCSNSKGAAGGTVRMGQLLCCARDAEFIAHELRDSLLLCGFFDDQYRHAWDHCQDILS